MVTQGSLFKHYSCMVGSGPATVASAQAVANELMNEKQTRESQFILIGQSLSAARWLAERDGRRQPRARRSCSVRCARAASRGPQIDSDDDNNPEIIFAESDQSYIKKLAAELLRCHDDLEGKISFVFDERHGTLRNAHGQPKPFDGEGLEAGLAATSPLYGPGPSWRKHPSSEEKEVRSRDMPRR